MTDQKSKASRALPSKSPIIGTAARLFVDKPLGALYHYTSLGALQSIVRDRALFATDARFLNDSTEMRVLSMQLTSLMADPTGKDAFNLALHAQFGSWLVNRIGDLGHAVFVTCFTQSGNLLSQWRSYGDANKGVSIGFDPMKLQSVAIAEGYQVGRCIYNTREQASIAREVLNAIEQQARRLFQDFDPVKPPSFLAVFEAAHADLLQIAVLFKNTKFSEEQEWRVVSSVITDYVKAPILYREGRSQLVPYMTIGLPNAADRKVDIEHAWLGPTPNRNTSLLAVTQFLTTAGASPRNGIGYCDVPYRTW